MRLTSVHPSADGGTFSVNLPAGFEPTIERERRVLKVHYEVTIIR